MFRFKIFIYVILISLLPLLFLGFPENFVQKTKTFMNRFSVPVLGFSHQLFSRVDDFFEVILDIWTVRGENEKLKNEVGKLQLEVERLKYLSDENIKLVELLEFAKMTPWKVLPARVIGRIPSQWNQSIWIDRGSKEEVKEGMAVITADGVVGRVIEVFPEWSRVLLLIDESCKIGAVISGINEMGIHQGSRIGRKCVLKYLPLDSKAKAGDFVVTSGLSKYFPPGIKLGTVQKVLDDELGLFQYAEVAPGVDFSNLQELLVILSGEKSYPSEAEE